MANIDQRHLLNKCLVIDLRRSPEVVKVHPGVEQDPEDDGFAVFKAWLRTNLETYWSPPLLSALRRLTLVGLLRPCMFLVTASPGHLEVIRAAWTQRTLRAPTGYCVAMLGEAHGYHVTPVAPGHFTSLPEAICHVVQALSEERTDAKITLDDICVELRRHFPHLELPDRGLVFSTLGRLVRERKVYHAAGGYRIVTPATYQQQLAREMELEAVRAGGHVTRRVQTDLADIIMGGTDSDVVMHAHPLPGEPLRQVAPTVVLGAFARRHSMKLSANQREEHFRRASSMRYATGWPRPGSCRPHYTDETMTSCEFSILERPSLLSKLVRLATPRRQLANQLATFGAQFPPLEWTSGDVRHLHSVGTQTAARRHAHPDGSPKLGRCRRQKHRRAANGSMDHLAETAETKTATVEPQMAPRSSTLPRRAKLSDLLAEGERYATGDSPESEWRKSSRTKREKVRTSEAPAGAAPQAAQSSAPAPDDTGSRVDTSAAASNGRVTTTDSGVGPDGASRRDSTLDSPGRSESHARRHVRERLEARARTSSRTSSGSSLERSDHSPASSLERDAKLRQPGSSQDGSGDPTNHAFVHESAEVNGHVFGQRSDPQPEERVEVDSGVGASSYRVEVVDTPRRGPPGTADVLPVHQRVLASASSPSPHQRVSSGSSGSPTHNGTRFTAKASPEHQPSAECRRSTRAKHKSLRKGRRAASPSDSALASLGPSDLALAAPGPSDSALAAPGPSNSALAAPGPSDSALAAPGPSDSTLAAPGCHVTTHVTARSHTESPSKRRHHRSPRHHAEVDVLNGTQHGALQNAIVVSPSHRQRGRRKESEADHVSNIVKSRRGASVGENIARRRKRIEVILKRGQTSHDEVPHEVAHQEIEPSTQRSTTSRRETQLSPPLYRVDEPVYENIGALIDSGISYPMVNSDTFVKTCTNVAVPSPKTHHRRHLKDTCRDAGGENGVVHKNMERSGPVAREVTRTQMNNEKVIEVVSPTRTEQLSVKNIFDEMAVPPKVPPKALIDGIQSEKRPGRPLTYQDLVKTSSNKTPDATIASSKMADATLVPSKMAGPALQSPKMADAAPEPSKTCAMQLNIRDAALLPDKTTPASPESTTAAPSQSDDKRPASPGDSSLRTYPSLGSLNLNFQSLAAQRLIHGASANSIDTLVEVNLAAERRRSGSNATTTLLGIL